jgi:glyoxylase-like metal-dependent hydrolase (beta-lactamase superfamily II)
MKIARMVFPTLLTLMTVPATADDESAITITRISEHIYKINAVAAFDVNFVASIGPDGILLVDTGFKETSLRLKELLLAQGKGQVKYVINTHAHVDHTGGNRVFGKDAVVISHSALRHKITKGRYSIEENPRWSLPDLTFQDNLTLYFNGEEIRIKAVPGSHDNDDLVVHFTQSKIAYMGDLAYGMNYPSYDTRTGDATRYAEAVARALTFLPDDVTVISGHGKDCTIPEMREYQQMLAETTRLVLAQLQAGKKASQIDAATLGKWANYAGPYQGADEWIESLVKSVERRDRPIADIIGPMYQARKDGDIHDAVAVFNKISVKSPDDYFGHLYLFGNFLSEQKAWHEAITIYSLANEAYPDNPFVWLFWSLQADRHLEAGEHAAALLKYQKSLEINPDNTDAREKLNRLETVLRE